jgi:hypothetical protein
MARKKETKDVLNKTNSAEKVKAGRKVSITARLTDGIDKKTFAKLCRNLGTLDPLVFFYFNDRAVRYMFPD